MAELGPKEKRRGLEFANQVAELAAQAPNGFAKKRTYRAVNEMRQEFGFSDAEKRRLIATYLDAGCSNYDDLIRETCFPKVTVIETVKAMEDEGLVEITQLSISTGGRKGTHIRLLADKNYFVTPKS